MGYNMMLFSESVCVYMCVYTHACIHTASHADKDERITCRGLFFPSFPRVTGIESGIFGFGSIISWPLHGVMLLCWSGYSCLE